MSGKAKGFAGWIDLFKSGTQTDSKGRTQDFTNDDLDSIISNHSAENPAPIVIGHPKDHAPAFGWTFALRRQGNVLQGKFKDVVKEFEDACVERRYRKRSISIEPDGSGGYKLNHVGFLGAVAPAVSGLKDIDFSSSDESLLFEQGMDDNLSFSNGDHRSIGWALDALARLFRGQREQIIEDEGIEQADKIIPEYQISSIHREADKLLHSPSSDIPNSFSKEPSQEPNMSKTQKELQAENERLKKQLNLSNYQARVSDCKVVVDDAVKRGALTPAQAQGMVEFMASLPSEENSAFEFSVGEQGETKKETPQAYLKRLLSSFGKQVPVGESTHEPPEGQQEYQSSHGDAVDPERAKLHMKALEYQKKNPGTSYVDAVFAIGE